MLCVSMRDLRRERDKEEMGRKEGSKSLFFVCVG